MPQFQLIETGDTSAYDALSTAAQHYVQAAFFTMQVPPSVIFYRNEDGKLETAFAQMIGDNDDPEDDPLPTMANWGHPAIQSAMEEGTLGGCIPCDASVANLDPESAREIGEYVDGWIAANRKLVNAALARPGYGGMEQIGHDLFLTGNGHGAGFWDREALRTGKLGDKLSDAARYNEVTADFNPETGLVTIE